MLLKDLSKKYQVIASELQDDEADSALMTESDKFKKYGPIVKTFKSSSNPNKTYEVRQLKGEKPTCNCPGWANRRSCKHTLEVEKHHPPIAASVPKASDAVADLMKRYFENRQPATASVVASLASKYSIA